MLRIKEIMIPTISHSQTSRDGSTICATRDICSTFQIADDISLFLFFFKKFEKFSYEDAIQSYTKLYHGIFFFKSSGVIMTPFAANNWCYF